MSSDCVGGIYVTVVSLAVAAIIYWSTWERLRMKEHNSVVDGTDKYRCKVCGTLWRLNAGTPEQPAGSWSLYSVFGRAGPCCDNVAMGDQIEPVRDDGLAAPDGGSSPDTEAVAEATIAKDVLPKRRITNDGSAVVPGFENKGSPGPIDSATGQHSAYWVLSAAERSRGFVRPVRRTYIHEKCGTATSMGQAIAETYARDPKFYGATFCVYCRAHFPVGATGEFVWDGFTKEKVGT